MSLAEIHEAVRQIAKEHAREQFRRENEAFLDSLRKRFCTDA